MKRSLRNRAGPFLSYDIGVKYAETRKKRLMKNDWLIVMKIVRTIPLTLSCGEGVI